MTQEILPAEETAPVARRLPVMQAIVLIAIVGLLALTAFAMRLRNDPGPQVGQLAPGFTLKTYDGQQVSLESLRGKVVVVNFWASWCVPCRDEAPILEQVWRQYKDRGVVFLGVDYVDTEPKALAYLKEFDVTYPNGIDLASKISQVYRISGVPETFFIGKDGKIAPVNTGAGDAPKYASPISAALLTGTIDKLLAEP